MTLTGIQGFWFYRFVDLERMNVSFSLGMGGIIHDKMRRQKLDATGIRCTANSEKPLQMFLATG